MCAGADDADIGLAPVPAHIAGFADQLTAAAAGRHNGAGHARVRIHRPAGNGDGADAGEAAMCVDGAERAGLRAQGQAIAGILQIAAAHDGAIVQLHRRAHGKAAIGRIGIGHGFARLDHQRQIQPGIIAAHGCTTTHWPGPSSPLMVLLSFAVHMTKGLVA